MHYTAWGGNISQENIRRINKFLQKAKRYGFTYILHFFKDFMEQSVWWEVIFSYKLALIIVCITCYIQIDYHSIWVYGPEATSLMYKYDLTRKSFIFRSSYNYR